MILVVILVVAIQEWTRPERILDDWASLTRREGTAGTQALDKLWDTIKDPLPRHLTARNAEGLAKIDEYVRSRQ